MEKATVDVSPASVTEGNAPPKDPEIATDSGQDKANHSSETGNKVSFWDYARIFSYSTIGDRFLMIAAGISAIGAGVTLPLVIVVFGQLIGKLIAYFMPGTYETKNQLLDSLNKLTYGRYLHSKNTL
jgi:hypothetical protein